MYRINFFWITDECAIFSDIVDIIVIGEEILEWIILVTASYDEVNAFFIELRMNFLESSFVVFAL